MDAESPDAIGHTDGELQRRQAVDALLSVEHGEKLLLLLEEMHRAYANDEPQWEVLRGGLEHLEALLREALQSFSALQDRAAFRAALHPATEMLRAIHWPYDDLVQAYRRVERLLDPLAQRKRFVDSIKNCTLAAAMLVATLGSLAQQGCQQIPGGKPAPAKKNPGRPLGK